MKNRVPYLPDLSNRYTGLELMDDLLQDTTSLYKTLDNFLLINKYLSKSYDLLIKYVFKNLIDKKCEEVKLLDIGSGGGDIALWFAKYARKLGIKATIYGLDHDQRCIDYSQKKCVQYPEVHFLKMPTDDLGSIGFSVDYIFTNHLFHHLENHKIPELLIQINTIAQQGFLVNDLRRSLLSYLGFLLTKPFFNDSSYTWRDGLMSIRRGFTKREAECLIQKAGLSETVKCVTMPPGRIVITNLKCS